MQKVIIAAPFGNYLRFRGTTSTLGTYTVLKRAGFVKRTWRVLKTVRYNWRSQSWLNKLGLPSPGIAALSNPTSDSILSIHGFNELEWNTLVLAAIEMGVEAMEFNFSCPNIEHRFTMIQEAQAGLELALASRVKVIAKLPPVRWMDMGKSLYGSGVRHYNLCNTIPTPGGGMSGKPLMQYSLWAIDDFRQAFGDSVVLIGGGGVTCLEDVKTYVRAGADHVSVASMLFNPFNWPKVRHFVDYFGPECLDQ